MEDFQVKIPGSDFILKSNTTYRVIGRVDKNSPREFQENGFSKIPSPYNYEKATPIFDNVKRVWDTGLYTLSPCYKNVKKEEVEETVKTLEENLVPQLKFIFEEGALSPKSTNNYFDTYGYIINQNEHYDTYEPQDFFGLWIALLSKTVAPEGEEQRAEYKEIGTPFMIIDREEKGNAIQNNDFQRSLATSNFLRRLTSDKKEEKEFLASVCEYVGFKANINSQATIVNSQFKNWIENKNDSLSNVKRFNEKMKYFETEEGKEELLIWNTLQKARRENKLKVIRQEYFLGEKSIGTNLNTAAKIVNESNELKSLVMEMIE